MQKASNLQSISVFGPVQSQQSDIKWVSSFSRYGKSWAKRRNVKKERKNEKKGQVLIRKTLFHLQFSFRISSTLWRAKELSNLRFGRLIELRFSRRPRSCHAFIYCKVFDWKVCASGENLCVRACVLAWKVIFCLSPSLFFALTWRKLIFDSHGVRQTLA